MTFVTPKGLPVELVSELARGGEGFVSTVRGRPDLVAKVYFQSPSIEQRRKLEVMIGAQSQQPALRSVSAWPVDLILAPSSRQAAGFLMPRLSDLKPVHLLFRTQDRRHHFPSAHWDFLLATALNVARAFSSLHRLGYVMGDVNESNLLVSPKDATVRLIDVDSFQVHDGPRTYRCGVGVPLFTPPELQGRTFSELDRTPNHDRFGLAVILFQLLFMGRHPFFGRFLGQGEMTPERAISEHRFAFGRNAQALLMERPPLTLPLGVLPNPIARSFERAFSPEGMRERPSADDWLRALEPLQTELAVCAIDTAHKFPKITSRCPWCDFESQGGQFFISAITTRNDATFSCHPDELRNILAQLNQIPTAREFSSMGPLPQLTLQSIPAGVSTAARKVRTASIAALSSGSLATAGIWAMAVASPSFGTYLLIGATILLVISCSYLGAIALRTGTVAFWQRSHDGFRSAQSSLERCASLLADRISAHAATDRQLRMRAADARHRFSSLNEDFRRSKIQLEVQREQSQIREHLERHRIQDANVSGIGPGRTADLRRHGFVSAADVLARNVRGVSGFGPVLAATLESWARDVQGRFRFDPRKGVSESDLVKLAFRFRALKIQTRKELERIVEEVRLEANRARADLRPLESERNEAYAVSTQHAAWIEELRGHLGISTNFKWLGVLAILLLAASTTRVISSIRPPAWEDPTRSALTSSSPSSPPPLSSEDARLWSSSAPPVQASFDTHASNKSILGVVSTPCFVRSSPSPDATRVGILERDTLIQIIENQGGWRLVRSPTMSGWTAPRCWTASRMSVSKDAPCADWACESSPVVPASPVEGSRSRRASEGGAGPP